MEKRMISCSPRSVTHLALLLGPLLIGACANPGDRTVVVAGNQGNYAMHREPNPLDSVPRQTAPPSTAPLGPTSRELEQQRRIEDLEAQQKSLQADIERLK